MKPITLPTKSIFITILSVIGYLFAWIAFGAPSTGALAMNEIDAQINQENVLVFLPLVTVPEPELEPPGTTIITLLSPASGSQLETLIPTFSFETTNVPNNTGGCLSFSIDPNPTFCMSSFGLSSYMQWERIAWFNLAPSARYYWRVGAVLNYDYNNIQWSEQRTFVTGPEGGIVLPAPTLVAPANNSQVDPTTLVLQWEAVTGAIEYDLLIRALDPNRFYGIAGIPGSVTQIGPTNLQWIVHSGNGLNYEWRIKARNDYAWSDYATPWNFSIPALQNAAIDQPMPGAAELFFWNSEPIVTQPWLNELDE